jgi:predicted HTH domain antitoxin
MNMTKTMSIRMDQDNYEFLTRITEEERSDLSKAVRDLVTRGRISLAVERYREGEVSLGKAAEMAGLGVGQKMVVLKKFGVKSKIDQEDYRQSVENLTKLW